MSRLLILLIIAVLLFFLLRSLFSRRRNGIDPGSRQKSEPGEVMVLDPHCQSYVPQREAIYRAGHFFCSENCARAFLER